MTHPSLRSILGFCLFGASLLAYGAAGATDNIAARVGYIPILGASQIFIAEKEGWAREAGFDLRFTTFESGPNMIPALASGTLDIYVGGIAPLAVARAKGIDVRVVAATATNEMTVTAGPKLAEFFQPGVTAAESFKRFHAATGRPAKLAAQPPGSVPHATLVHWLFEAAHVDRADFDVIGMGIDATQQALLAGAIDGCALREPAVTVSEKRDPRIKIVALGNDMFPDQPGTVVAVSGPFLDKHRAAVEKLVAALVRATTLIKTDPDRAAGPIEAALGKGIIDHATIVQALASPASTFISDPRVITAPFAAMQAYQVKIGTLDKEAPLEGLFEQALYDRAAKTN